MSDAAAYCRTPLFSAHQALGARLVPFAGYEMPVQYSSIMAEAKSVREDAGMFDVSHMARLRITGHSEEFLEKTTTNDISKITATAGQYSLLPNERGGCVDDIIVYRFGAGFRMVVNASNHEKDVAWLSSFKPDSVVIDDETDQTVMIAVQGPRATQRLASLSPCAEDLHGAPPFGVVWAKIAGVETQAARSGYTGEDGYELICDAADAVRLWEALLDSGVTPCGLGARDTLRVEAGLPLYGHELSDDMSPISAGLGWVISKTKTFIGSEPMNLARTSGTPTKLVGIILDSKRLATPGMNILLGGQPVGKVSSGVISPTLDTGIALAFVSRDIPLDTACFVDTRGKRESGRIVSKRMFKRS